MTTRLATEEMERLRRAPLTYDCVGGTLTGQIDDGYQSFTRLCHLPHASFAAAVERLMTWQVHERAGLRVAASAARAAKDEVVLMRLGIGRASLHIPCRVVYVIDEPERAGFAYGTLPGHPETGEELFLLEHVGDGIRFGVHGFSQPRSRLAKLSGPLGRGFQDIMTNRYLRAAGA